MERRCARATSKARKTALIEAVQTTGTNRVILCRCDNRSAVEFGQALGISLFQGRYLDTFSNPDGKGGELMFTSI